MPNHSDSQRGRQSVCNAGEAGLAALEGGKFMPAYVIAEIAVHDPETYEQYKLVAAASVVAHGGTYKVRGGRVDSLEGDPVAGRVVVLEFPSFEAAQNWYCSEDYRAAVSLRHEAADSRVFIVEGAEPLA